MTGEVLLNQEDYRVLRIEAREAMHRVGIYSNPGFTNENIINGLANAIGEQYETSCDVEHPDFSGEFFRDSLGELLGLEIPPRVEDVVAKLREIE